MSRKEMIEIERGWFGTIRMTSAEAAISWVAHLLTPVALGFALNGQVSTGCVVLVAAFFTLSISRIFR